MPAASEGTYPYAVLCLGLYGTQPVDPIGMAVLLLSSVKYLFLQEAGRPRKQQGVRDLTQHKSRVSYCDSDEDVNVRERRKEEERVSA
jgi:hypothetical protein